MSTDSALDRMRGQPRWSFAMGIACIVWRDLNEVKRHWDAYRREQAVLRNKEAASDPEALLSHPEQRNGAYHWVFIDALRRAERGDAPRLPIEEAKPRLWEGLKSEMLKAEGVDPVTGKRVEIPGREFEELDLYHDKGRDRLRSSGVQFGGLKDLYLSPTLMRIDLLRVWPGAEKVLGRGRKKGDGSLAKLDEPFLDDMRKLIEDGKAASPEAAARLIAGDPKVYGANTSVESKVDRLAKRYRSRSNFRSE